LDKGDFGEGEKGLEDRFDAFVGEIHEQEKEGNMEEGY
jgi:hypothetical protein